ncbi:MAG TPA: hypothetical protein VFI95_19450 [Terriglobales bacterium]|nr:hypothetical protein [Terriglobales bacterium]
MQAKPVVSAFLMLGIVTCAAQIRRGQEPLCKQEGTARADITDADATILGFTIAHASLEDVQAKLGSTELRRVSKDEESDVSICYVSPADRTILVFYSGAMGGWKDITWFALWSREAMYPHSSECASSSLVSRNLATVSGLRLGLTKKELEKIAGRPTKDGTRSVKYDYVCRSKMTADEVKGMKDVNGWDATSDPYFDRMSWIEVLYAHGAASRLDIGRIESY